MDTAPFYFFYGYRLPVFRSKCIQHTEFKVFWNNGDLNLKKINGYINFVPSNVINPYTEWHYKILKIKYFYDSYKFWSFSISIHTNIILNWLRKDLHSIYILFKFIATYMKGIYESFCMNFCLQRVDNWKGRDVANYLVILKLNKLCTRCNYILHLIFPLHAVFIVFYIQGGVYVGYFEYNLFRGHSCNLSPDVTVGGGHLRKCIGHLRKKRRTFAQIKEDICANEKWLTCVNW